MVWATVSHQRVFRYKTNGYGYRLWIRRGLGGARSPLRYYRSGIWFAKGLQLSVCKGFMGAAVAIAFFCWDIRPVVLESFFVHMWTGVSLSRLTRGAVRIGGQQLGMTHKRVFRSYSLFGWGSHRAARAAAVGSSLAHWCMGLR